jgi:hypothetical protein
LVTATGARQWRALPSIGAIAAQRLGASHDADVVRRIFDRPPIDVGMPIGRHLFEAAAPESFELPAHDLDGFPRHDLQYPAGHAVFARETPP